MQGNESGDERIHKIMNQKYLETALQAIEQASKVTKKYFNQKYESHLKDDHTYVTQADQEVEELISSIILSSYPNHSILGEESTITKVSSEPEYFWVIDPIDNTRHFMRGLPFFSTELALVHKGKVVLGVSSVPMLNKVVHATYGHGTFVNGERVQVSKTSSLKEICLLHGAVKYFSSDQLFKLRELAKKVSITRCFCGGWSYHFVAQGQMDVSIELYSKPWDIAAEHIIVTEAGGTCTDIQGQPITFHFAKEKKTLVASNEKIHQQILDVFSQDLT